VSANGVDALVVLAERITELEAAHRLLCERIEEQYRPRILALEADVDRIARALAALMATGTERRGLT
jgi:hypothetical protein